MSILDNFTNPTQEFMYTNHFHAVYNTLSELTNNRPVGKCWHKYPRILEGRNIINALIKRGIDKNSKG